MQIDSIAYDDLPPDDGTVVPFAHDLNGIDDDSRKRMDALSDALLDWPPAQLPDLAQRVRNLLSLCRRGHCRRPERAAYSDQSPQPPAWRYSER